MTSTTRRAAARHAFNPVVERHDAPDYPSLRIVPRRHLWRWTGSLLALALLVALAHTLATNPQWDWPTFGRWFFDPSVLAGLGKTLALTALSTLFGIVLGTLLALARLSRSPLLSALAWLYIWLFRSLPLILVLIILYNFSYLYERFTLAVPFTSLVLFDYPTIDLLGPFTVAVLGLGLVQAAYTAEIVRGGILGVDQGQFEAAAALGLPVHRQISRIILPQALRSILPTGFNEIISLAKGTALVYVIALPELFYTVQVIYNRTQTVIPLLMVATAWYLVITSVLSVIQYYIERHFARGALRQLPPTPFARLRGWLGRAV